MKKNSDVENLFSNTIICAIDQEMTKEEVFFYKGIGNEHGFSDIIVDLDTSNKFSFRENICAINFPYNQMDTKSIQLLLDNDHIQNNKLIMFVNKYDVLLNKWDDIKAFSRNISEKKDRKIYLACDLNWIDVDDLSRFFSSISYYENIVPVLTLFSKKMLTSSEIFEIASKSSTESTSPVYYYGPLPNSQESMISLTKTGFDKLIIQAKVAVKLVTTL